MPALAGAERFSLDEAQELLRKGDEAYQAGRYQDAAQAYAGARESLQNEPALKELRDAATERFVLASIEHGRALVRKGDLAGAKAAVNQVLEENVAPKHPAATAYLAELEDPIRTNSALTPQHAADVDRVRRELYTAEGAYNLGDYKKATKHYEDVLRIDPTNSAARRGMERVAVAKSDYYGSANDHTRAELLAQVDKGWELQVTDPVHGVTLGQAGAMYQTGSSFIPVANKLDRIVLPTVRLEQTSIEEALDFLRLRVSELDELELDPARKGINFVLNLGDPQSEPSQQIRNRRFDLQLNNVPVSQVLRYINEATRTSYSVDEYSVIIRPVGQSTDEMVTRTYRVPPDFISNLSAGASQTANDDPFASPAPRSILPQRLSALEALRGQGVAFPEGASATFNEASSTLRVTNTLSNHDIIDQLVSSAAQTEPVLVSVKVTMIRTEETRLKELGFDWLLTNFGSGFGFQGGTRSSGGNLLDMVPGFGSAFDPALAPTNPITAGNRSGTEAIPADSLDALLASESTGSIQTSARAPGIFSVSGVLGNHSVQMMMRGLDQKKGVDIMANPATVTRSGQASAIHIVREFIYPTEYEPPELPNSTGSTEIYGAYAVGGEEGVVLLSTIPASDVPITPAHPTAFEKRDVGTILEVLPTADANKHYIDLAIKPSISDFEGFVNYGSPITGTKNILGIMDITLPSPPFPPFITFPDIPFVSDSYNYELTRNAILMPIFSDQRLSTNVTLADGATVVLGGLLQQKMTQVEDKTPVFGDIPVVGRLFQSKASQPISTAIIFLVNVQLLDPTGRPYAQR